MSTTYGTIRKISLRHMRCELVDENGTLRYFDRSDIAEVTDSDKHQLENVEEWDGVSFDLTGLVITNIAVVAKHRAGTVFSW